MHTCISIPEIHVLILHFPRAFGGNTLQLTKQTKSLVVGWCPINVHHAEANVLQYVALGLFC
jgi:hypothetical protein